MNKISNYFYIYFILLVLNLGTCYEVASSVPSTYTELRSVQQYLNDSAGKKKILVIGTGRGIRSYPPHYYLINGDQHTDPDLVAMSTTPNIIPPALHGKFDVVIWEFGWYPTLNNQITIANIKQALKPNGVFMGDVPLVLLTEPDIAPNKQGHDLLTHMPPALNFGNAQWWLTNVRPNGYFCPPIGSVQQTPFLCFAHGNTGKELAFDHYKNQFSTWIQNHGFTDPSFIPKDTPPEEWRSSNAEFGYFLTHKL